MTPEYITLIIVVSICLIILISIIAMQHGDFLKNKIKSFILRKKKPSMTQQGAEPETVEPQNIISQTDYDLLCNKINQLIHMLVIPQEENNEPNVLLDKLIKAVNQILEDNATLLQGGRENNTQLIRTKQKNEQLEKECNSLKKQQEIYEHFYLTTLNADKDEDAKFILLKEVEKFRYSVRAINAIQHICSTIENSTDYDSLKKQVNRILFELNQYVKNLGGM